MRGKQTQILGGQQRGNASAKMISMAINAVYYYQFKKKKKSFNSFLMQELKLYMA